MKKILTLILGSMFALTIFVGCTEESRYTTFPETGIAELEIIKYTVETHWQTHDEAERSDRTAHIHPGFYRGYPEDVDEYSISYWTEINVYNQYDTFINTIEVALTFLDSTDSELFTIEKILHEGMDPGDARWITIPVYKHKEDYVEEYDFTQVSDIDVVVKSVSERTN